MKTVKYIISAILLVLGMQAYAQHDLYGIWARKAGVISGSESAISVTSMITDSKGNTYVYGTYRGTVNLSDNTCELINSEGHPYTGEYISYTNGSTTYSGVGLRSDGFVSKYDNKGEWVWSVRLISNVADQIRGITLADNEQSLIFLGTYGNHIYSSIRPAAGSCKIIFGDGGETVLPYSVPRDTYCNGVLCKVSTTDGSEKFSSYLSYGSNISTDPNYFLYFDAMYANAAGDIFVTGEIGTPHDQFIYKYNSAGTRIDSKRHADQSSYDLHVQNISRNQNTSGFYTYEVSGKGVGQYDSRITKINPTDLSKTYLSHISRGVYGGPSVIPQSMDVNNAETHLFLTGTVAGEFSIQSTGQPINWKGGNDGVIICFDPQNANAAGNIRWMVNLNSGGNESVTSCKFDETAQVLRVTGYLGTNEVDFNPLGTAMKRKSPLSNSIFYAVYDLNGICQHVDMLGTTFGSEIGYALDVAGTNMSLFGTFDGSPFQADPSKRLDPLRTTQNSAFIAKYSLNPLSTPDPLAPASYSTADKLRGSYGMARHDVMSCLSLGSLNDKVDYNTSWSYVPGYSGFGTVNPNYDGLVSLHPDVPVKGYSIKVNAKNAKDSEAYLTAWIDFNGNGKFDPEEASEVETVPAKTAVLTEFTLKWIQLPVITRSQLDSTYLRIRLASEMLDGTWAEGNAIDGEVEDYKIRLDFLELSKTAVSNNTDPAKANIGDTITYTINLVNKVSGDILVFDPIPEGTEYVSSTPAGTEGTVYFYGENVDAISWSLNDLTADINPTFTMKVVVTGKPANSDSIVNIAFAVMNGDTISSSGSVCDLAEIEVNKIRAVDDYAQTIINKPVIIDVLSNDQYLSACNPIPYNLTVPTNGGSVLVNGNKIEYTPAIDYVGVDTFNYTVNCGSTVSVARVVVIVFDPDNISNEICYDDPVGFTWSIKPDFVSAAENNHVFVIPLVGDIDGDGIPDIITVSNNTRILNIYWGKDRANTNVPTTLTMTTGVDIYWDNGEAISPYAIFKTKIGGVDKSIVIVNDGSNLYAYDLNGPANQSGKHLWKTELSGKTINRSAIGIADFNNDGIPEVYVRNKIFNAHTGKLLVEGTTASNTGNIGYCHSARGSEYFTIAADVIGDPRLELIAGTEVYAVNIVDVNDNSANKNTLTRVAKLNVTFDNGITVINDGKTIVADINQDGKLDVVFITSNGGTTKKLIAWDVETESLLLESPNFVTDCTGIPLIGNIDDTPDLEVSFVIIHKLVSYKPNFATKKFDLAYQLAVSDRSGATGMTLFDFNQDKKAEIVYRDESRLRIMKTVPPVVVGGVGSFENLKEYAGGSGTWYEYPIVADVDNDGSGEIIVISGNGYVQYGTLRIYRSGNENAWAPARRVWNQYAYNAVNVNDDLTIPRFQMNPAIMFPGDIQPYNAFLQQQTVLNKDGKPLYLLPDAAVIVSPSPQMEYYPDGDSIVLTVQFENNGASALKVPAYVTAYKNSIANGNAIATDSIMVPFYPGETGTAQVTIRNVHDYMPMNNIVVRINDNKGKGGFGQAECDELNNDYTFNALYILTDDYAQTETNKPVIVDILRNDLLGNCTEGGLESVKISNIWMPQHGLAEVVMSSTDTLVKYTPDAGWYGVDSLRYIVTDCNSVADSAWVYILTHKLLSKQYVACPGAIITLGFTPIVGVEYNWYTVAAGGSVIAGGDNIATLTATKDNTPVQTWWVEPVWKGMTLPRYRVDLSLSDNCGEVNPIGCVVDGTPIFQENFGGNKHSDPNISPVGIGLKSEYEYTANVQSTNFGNNKYTIAKTITPAMGLNQYWHTIYDHTHEADHNMGYCFVVNGDTKKKVYELDVEGLCGGSELYFSLWIANILKSGLSWGVKPDIEFVISDKNTGEIISIFRTGETITEENKLVWKLYGMPLALPSGVTDITFKVYSYGNGGAGNDYAIDDIEVRLCAPPINININVGSDTVVCRGSKLDIIADYTDDNTFGEDLTYRWEYRDKESDTWTSLKQQDVHVASGGTFADTWTINPIEFTDEGYYRILVSTQGNINNKNCRASSDSIYVRVFDGRFMPDVRVQSCTNIGNINLTSYLDTANFKSVIWSASASMPVVGAATGIINSNSMVYPNTYIYKFKVENTCGNAESTMYVKTLQNSTIGLPPDTVVVCYKYARDLQLNRIFGIEAKGAITSDDINIQSYITTAITPPHTGAAILNGYKAYNELSNSYDYIYRGVTSKKVILKYKITDPASCLYGTDYELVVILTSVIVP